MVATGSTCLGSRTVTRGAKPQVALQVRKGGSNFSTMTKAKPERRVALPIPLPPSSMRPLTRRLKTGACPHLGIIASFQHRRKRRPLRCQIPPAADGRKGRPLGERVVAPVVVAHDALEGGQVAGGGLVTTEDVGAGGRLGEGGWGKVWGRGRARGSTSRTVVLVTASLALTTEPGGGG